jgi:hypothetical protein
MTARGMEIVLANKADVPEGAAFSGHPSHAAFELSDRGTLFGFLSPLRRHDPKVSPARERSGIAATLSRQRIPVEELSRRSRGIQG